MPLPEQVQKLFDEAFETGSSVPIGRHVICDGCDGDYTESPDPGGLIFQSKAYCPVCAPCIAALARKYDEENMIRGRCPEDQSFADFVRAFRGPDSVITVTRLPKADDSVF